MTDREKLIELLHKGVRCPGTVDGLGCSDCPHHSDDDPCDEYGATADMLIAHGVTVQEWRPVTERLPENDLPKDSKAKQIKVIVAYTRNGYWVVRTNLRKKGGWYKRPDEWSWSVSDPITHWMPIPEPPEEDKT